MTRRLPPWVPAECPDLLAHLAPQRRRSYEFHRASHRAEEPHASGYQLESAHVEDPREGRRGLAEEEVR